MARPLRIELAGGLYHVTSRGNGGNDIYFSDADREMWLVLLGAVCRRYHWRCHAWCQMDNHYHIVVETPEPNLALGMRQLNGMYTQDVNRLQNRMGHIFQGRYKAILVERESYLLELSRYVVLNPVRAGKVDAVDAWPWSSYHAMVGSEPAPDWLDTDWLLGQFARRRSLARQRYIDFVGGGVGLPSVWEALSGQIYLGSEDFVRETQAAFQGSLDVSEVPRQQRRPPAEPLVAYQEREPDRNAAICAAFASGAYTLQQIGQHFGLHYATVSRIVRQGEARGSHTGNG